VHESDGMAQSPIVTVVVPVRNEAGTIGAALESLAAQDIGADALEVVIVDGESSDMTRSVCERLESKFPWGRFIPFVRNKHLTAPHALNGGLKHSTCPWFTRLDARTRMSPNYLSCCIQHLERAGDPLRAAAGRFIAEVHGTRTSAAIATALSHPLGVGRSYRTIIAEKAEVDHHPFAVWSTDAVRQFGGFDEELTRNQDDEFSDRARAQGGRIEMLGRASIRYRPRDRFRGLAAQYFQYGLWKSAVGRTRGYFPVRSFVPAGTTLLTFSLPASIVRRGPLPPPWFSRWLLRAWWRRITGATGGRSLLGGMGALPHAFFLRARRALGGFPAESGQRPAR